MALAYYNEIDPKAAAWLRQLIKMGLIMAGDVDERSIIDVEPKDLNGYTRHHFFAGLGGWDYALQLAGWPKNRPVCTASLPCQPFSVAGAGKGKADERHLLPRFIELVRGAGFRTIFGEQVPGAIKHGWLDDLCDNLERENYTVRAAVLTAAGAGAPHIRQRLYWLAYYSGKGLQEQQCGPGISRQKNGEDERQNIERSSELRRMADSGDIGSKRHAEVRRETFGRTEHSSGGMVYTNGTGPQPRRELAETAGYRDTVESASSVGGMGHSESDNKQRDRERETMCRRESEARGSRLWADCEWLQCRDGKQRPIKPGIEPLVDGVSGRLGRGSDPRVSINANATQEARVMRLKGYGNAIVPQVAAEFVSLCKKRIAHMDALSVSRLETFGLYASPHQGPED